MIRKSDDDGRERERVGETNKISSLLHRGISLFSVLQTGRQRFCRKKTIAQVTEKKKREREREEKRREKGRHVDERKLELNTCGHFCPEKITLSMSFLL